jgi:predicted DNA-binding transcriptional regulator YafY
MEANEHRHAGMTVLIARLRALLDALRAAPLDRPSLLRYVMGTAYRESAHTRRMIDRDIEHLKTLGIIIERSRTRPPVYTLRGGVPVFSEEHLRVLSLIRDTFGNNHPQAAQVQTLLEHLTSDLTEAEYQAYAQQQPLRVPVQPAIDYTPYASLIDRLQTAISRRQIVCFHYQSTRGFFPTLHRRVEPYEIEYYERHFYLVAYSHKSGQVHDFRIDRITDDESFQVLERLPPGMEHARDMVTFRYRLAAKLTRSEISQRFAEQRVVEHCSNGDVVIEAKGRSSFFIVRTLLKYAGNAEILEPAWLREEMVKEIKALVGMYRLGGD